MGKRYVWSNIGSLLVIVGVSMLLPMAAGLYFREAEYKAFGQSALATIFIGLLLHMATRQRTKKKRISLRDGYALVTYGWIVVTLFAMVPYLLTGTFHNVTDAFFETMSGFTTVGASVLDDIEGTPQCVLLWRSLTHWLGGMGILVLFVALMAGHGTGAMQIFKAESSGPVQSKLEPKIMETARVLWCIYMITTMIVISLYCLAGMGLFDAVNHGFSVISTGGFSTKVLSIGHYHNALIDWVTVFSMFVAGINYSLYFYALRTRSLRCFVHSLELKVYAAVVVIATVAVLWFIAPGYHYNLPLAFRHAAFQVVSILTTTGFITCDFEQWALPAQFILMLLMLCGACAGSTTGGIKIDRHVILAQKAVQEIRRFLHPRMVTRLKSNNQLVDDDVVLSVMTFFYIYLFLIVIGTYLVCMLGGGMLDSLTAVMSCLGGVGPALGAWGPMESYSSAPVGAKWILSFLMLLGRLEIYTVLVLFRSPFQKRKHKKQETMLESLEENAILEPMVREK
ncbi:MAG: TrkH family potassium uptake protein [Peptococcaceae bacterium]|nr:TrkH family potassium uptake protein [Peptococcaceae bacterium]